MTALTFPASKKKLGAMNTRFGGHRKDHHNSLLLHSTCENLREEDKGIYKQVLGGGSRPLALQQPN